MIQSHMSIRISALKFRPSRQGSATSIDLFTYRSSPLIDPCSDPSWWGVNIQTMFSTWETRIDDHPGSPLRKQFRNSSASLHQQQQQSGATYEQHYFYWVFCGTFFKISEGLFKGVDYCICGRLLSPCLNIDNTLRKSYICWLIWPTWKTLSKTWKTMLETFLSIFHPPQHQRPISLLSQSAIHAHSPRQTGDLDPKP